MSEQFMLITLPLYIGVVIVFMRYGYRITREEPCFIAQQGDEVKPDNSTGRV